jgi:predicted acylesterase/phospholipase RssA
MNRRDVAVVLSGGGMNAIMLEVGFLRRLRESELWPRIFVYFGSSAGALAGCMAVLDRLGDLEEFLLGLRPEDAFRGNTLWRLPLLGTHDYVLPRTIEKRLGDPVEFAKRLAEAETELVAIVTDVTPDGDVAPTGGRLFERAYSSRDSPPEEMARAVLASAAISALVLPMTVGDRIATDGSWVRKFPLGYAYERPDTELIVSFRYRSSYAILGAAVIARLAGRMRRLTKVPGAAALHAELQEAVDREARGEPAHIVDIFSRLSRVSIIRNTELEEMVAAWRDLSVRELAALREDVLDLIEDARAREAVEARFAAASFPFRHDRIVPRIAVEGAVEPELSLDPGFRRPRPWTVEAKRELLDRGYEAADEALRTAGVT